MKRRDILTAALLVAAVCPLVLADKKADRKQRRAERKAAASAKDGKKKSSDNYLRLLRDKEENPTALQTSVVQFSVNGKRKKKKNAEATSEATRKVASDVTVDLIGAVHIGDRRYYQTLNKLFEDYDVVLYELVAPDGTVPTPALRAQAGGNPISGIQSMTKEMLDLDSQLELVDYTKKNFVHADMSPEAMAEKMRERGDTGLSVALSAAADIFRQANARANDGKNSKMEEMNPVEMLLSFRDSGKMKRLMAEQFAEAGAMDTGLGDTLNRMIVADRNAAVMKILDREMKKGHKKIGIFYGAAHMPDFEERLDKNYSMKPKKPTWITAWDLTKESKKKEAKDPLDALLNLLGG